MATTRRIEKGQTMIMGPYRSVRGPLARVAENWAKAWMEPIHATVDGEWPWRKVCR
jgi:hypothetical protein